MGTSIVVEGNNLLGTITAGLLFFAVLLMLFPLFAFVLEIVTSLFLFIVLALLVSAALAVLLFKETRILISKSDGVTLEISRLKQLKRNSYSSLPIKVEFASPAFVNLVNNLKPFFQPQYPPLLDVVLQDGTRISLMQCSDSNLFVQYDAWRDVGEKIARFLAVQFEEVEFSR